MSSVSQIPGTSNFSLLESLKELQSSHQSSFVVLGHQMKTSSPSVGLRIDSASLIVYAKGSLEDDGGFDGLRQILNVQQDLQFVFFRFCSKLILVQLIPEDLSAVQRARSMVFGRSLAAQIPLSNHSSKINIITISTPSQLTDPFLRSQLALGTSPGQSKFLPRSITQSSSISSHVVPTTHDRSPDVPISVSSTTLQSSPFPQSTSLSTIDTSSSNSHATQISLTGLPAVGLGIGGMGRDAISPFRETFEDPSNTYHRMMVEHDDDEKRRISSCTVMPVKRFNNSFGILSSPPFMHNATLMGGESYVGDSESEYEDELPPQQFPDPPKRNSQRTTMSGKLAAPRKSVGQLSNSMSTTSAWIDSYEQRSPIKHSGSDSLFTVSKTSVIDPESSIDSGHFSKKAIHSRSVRHAPSLPSMLSSFSQESGVQQSVHGRTHHGPSVFKNNQTNCVRPISISASSAMTHESVFAELQNGRDLIFKDENESYTVEELEKERLDFLRWKEEQERIILAKEVQRERQRRILDEAKREHVMRRLLKEQSLSDQNLTAAIEDDDRGNKIGEVKQSSKAIRPMKSKSTLSSNSQSDEYKMDIKSAASSKTRSKRSHTTGTRSTQSPLHPPPPLPLPKSPSDSLVKGRETKISEESSENIAAIFARHSKTQSEELLDGLENLKLPTIDQKNMTVSSESDPIGRLTYEKKVRKQISPPLADSVKAAIEREMRRPVITLEGHVRPRVRQLRSQTYSSGQRTSDLQPAFDETLPVLSVDGNDDIAKSPLIKSMMEAKEKARLFSQTTGSKSDNSDHHENISFDEMTEKVKSFASPNASSSPALIKIVDPNGKGVGSGWALSEVKGMQVGNPVDKDLPVTPRASNSFTTNSPGPSLLNLSEMVGFAIDAFDEERKSINNNLANKPEMHSDESEIDFAANEGGNQQRKQHCSKVRGRIRTATDSLNDEETIKSHSDSSTNEANLEIAHSPDEMRKPMESSTQSPTISSLPQTSSMTLIDQIFRSKLSASRPESQIPEKTVDSNPETGLTNEQFNAILARQNQLDKLLSDLQRKRTITKEVEGAARARWARQQVERQRLDAYERSLLESEERLRRAKTDNLVSLEEKRQRQLEDEHAVVERKIIEEEERRKVVAQQKEIRLEKLRIAQEMQKQLHQEIEGMQQSRHQRRLQIYSEMKEKITSENCCFLNGSVTIQFGSGQKFRRAFFELFNDRLDLYNQSKDESSKKLIESIKIIHGSIIQISEAFEEVQVPHAFSIHLAPVAHSGKLGELKEPLIAYTDNEHSKERLMAGLSVLSGLEAG